jgi:hypothetical protein
MASLQRTIPTIPTQPHLCCGPTDVSDVIEARKHLLRTLRGAVGAINAEIFRLETTGDLVDTDLEKTYMSLAWAVDAFREEQELALDAANSASSKRGSGRFTGGLRSGEEVRPCSWQ